jgi:hypothetical protein
MNPGSGTRSAYAQIARWLEGLPLDLLEQRRQEAEALFRRIGITFLVYGDDGGTERLIPFDVLPRIFTGAEWARIEAGCIQRVRALNLFLDDIYHGREICRADIVPESEILQNPAYRPEMHGVAVPRGVYAHIAGIDIVRTGELDFHVLEDNLRTPSGVYARTTDRTRADDSLRAFAERRRAALDGDEVAGLHELALGVAEAVRSDERASEVHASAAEALAKGAGGLPGPCPCLHRGLPSSRLARALRHRLSRIPRWGASRARPRLGRGGDARSWLGRFRSRQRLRCDRRLSADRGRVRRCRRGPRARRPAGRRRGIDDRRDRDRRAGGAAAIGRLTHGGPRPILRAGCRGDTA